MQCGVVAALKEVAGAVKVPKAGRPAHDDGLNRLRQAGSLLLRVGYIYMRLVQIYFRFSCYISKRQCVAIGEQCKI